MMSKLENIKSLAIPAAITSGVLIGSYGTLQAFKKRYYSKNYKLIGHVSDIMQFPVKGLRGNHLCQATVTNRRIVSKNFHDRSFVVYKADTKNVETENN